MENQRFLEKAEQLNRKLKKWRVRSRSIVKCARVPEAWQGWQMVPVATPSEFLKKSFRNGARFILDFGEEFVGQLCLKLTSAHGYNDSPVRLKLIFAEAPIEIGERGRKCKGSLSPAWIQEEIVTLDNLPQTYKLPRVYAMRYVYVEVLATPDTLLFEDVFFMAQSAVHEFIPPLPSFDQEDILLDLAAQRTLRNCMQEVVLDGPKRDRRLWLGDLRLDAQVNSVTFRNFDLFERCIYLLSAFPHENGQIPACVFDKPHPCGSPCAISDCSFLFADMILFHYQQTGNLELLKELYPLASKQFEIFRPYYRNGVTEKEIPGWNFIDWCELDRNTAEAGVYLFGLRKLAKIAAILGHKSDQTAFEQEISRLSAALRKDSFDRKQGLFFSGPRKEISYASQIWMVLAEVVTGNDAKEVLSLMENCPDAIRPVTPYLHHHLLAAYDLAGEKEKLRRHMRNYWGEMIWKGMNVFPEVFVPENERLTPYGNEPRMNSACHAMSCAPAYFLRKEHL